MQEPSTQRWGMGGSTEREYLIASQKGIKGANRGGPEGTRDTKNANKVYSPADRRERYVRTFRRHGNVFSAAMEINRPSGSPRSWQPRSQNGLFPRACIAHYMDDTSVLSRLQTLSSYCARRSAPHDTTGGGRERGWGG